MCGFPVVLSRDLELPHCQLFVSQELIPKLLNVGVNVFWCLCCWVPLCPTAVSVSWYTCSYSRVTFGGLGPWLEKLPEAVSLFWALC